MLPSSNFPLLIPMQHLSHPELFSTTHNQPQLHGVLERIKNLDRSLHAWAHLSDEIKAVQSTAQASRRLEGIAFGVKDVLDVRGMPTRCGSEYLDTMPAARDAACVATLRNAGAIPIGKTHTAEFAYRSPPLTNNPAAPGHTPGGSSSGSAAAVAAQMVPFALSTQTGGSIIRPAAYCGTVGFKPSFGLVSRYGLAPGCESLDTIGWHATNLDIAHRVAQVFLDHRNTKDEPSFATKQTFKVLCIRAPGEEAAHVDVMSNLQQVCQTLKLHDWTVLEQNEAHNVALSGFLQSHKTIMHYELSRSLLPIVSHHARVSPPVAELLQTGQSVSYSDYIKALALQAQQRQSWDAFANGADIILAPSAPTAANPGMEQSGSSAYCRAWTFLGWPCLHVPLGVSEAGLPLGLQVVAPWLADDKAFHIAKLIWQINT